MKTIVRAFVKTLANRLREKDVLIQAVLGPRQVGKTTGVKQCLSQVKSQSLYVSADELVAPNAHWLLEQWQRALLLPRHSILVIDEIQKVDRWQEALKNVQVNKARIARERGGVKA